MKQELSELGKLIEQRRMELHLTKTALINDTHVSPNAYYRMISGDIGHISLKTMTNVARALGMSLTSLLKHDPAYGSRQDYFYNKRLFYEALDPLLDLKLHELNAPVQLPVYERVFLAIMYEVYHSGEKHIGTLPIPDEVAGKPGMKFVVQVYPGKKTPAPPKYAVLAYDKRMNIKLGLSDGQLHCITNKTKVDSFGYCYWDDQRGVVKIDRITHGATPIEIEYADVTYICEVLMLIYV